LEELRDVRPIFFCGSASSVAMALTWLLNCWTSSCWRRISAWRWVGRQLVFSWNLNRKSNHLKPFVVEMQTGIKLQLRIERGHSLPRAFSILERIHQVEAHHKEHSSLYSLALRRDQSTPSSSLCEWRMVLTFLANGADQPDHCRCRMVLTCSGQRIIVLFMFWVFQDC